MGKRKTNQHGIYVQIARQIAPNEVLVQLKHTQQLGFDFLQKGVPVEFVQGLSLITKGNAVVLEAERINKDFTRVKLSEPLPEGIKVGDAIGELRKFPAIHIHDNYIGKNRGRPSGSLTIPCIDPDGTFLLLVFLRIIIVFSVYSYMRFVPFKQISNTCLMVALLKL